MSTACVIVIGNEILSGRTKDENVVFLARELNNVGVRLLEVRIVPDIPQAIIKAVNECRISYDYVFTTGGIGPTHDDITARCIAEAFGVPCERNAEALEVMTKYYTPQHLNEARLRMTDMPHGAALIPNPVSVAPGFIIENVYVMAGVPRIAQAMFDHIKYSLKGGKPMLSATVSAFVTEGTIAKALSEIQDRYADVEIGSYPFVRAGKLGTSLVARHTDAARVAQVQKTIADYIRSIGGVIEMEENA